MDEKDIVKSYESLYKAFKKAKKNKPYNGSCAKFQMMTLEGLHMLKEQLDYIDAWYEAKEEKRLKKLERRRTRRMHLEVAGVYIVAAVAELVLIFTDKK